MTDDAFSHWLPLTAATPERVPEEPGMIQVKLGDALVGYPTGRSAMVLYRAGPSCRALATALCHELPWAHRPLSLRFRLTDAPEALMTRLHGRFVERFGAPPSLPGRCD